MNDSYAQYQMTDWGWIQTYKERMGSDQFHDYVNNVYALLMNLKVGMALEVDRYVKPENTDLFIKVCCMFIQESRQINLTFSDNFKFLKRDA